MDFVIAGTRNASDALSLGADMLRTGGSALDAVESVIRQVEENLSDWSVGKEGFPNLLGETELDAGIMVGSSRQAGAVAAIKHYSCPISIARKVMELSPHVLLVGEGAELFAKSLGYEQTELTSKEMYLRWKNSLEGKGILFEQDSLEIRKLAERYGTNIKESLENFDFKAWYTKLSQFYHGTVNVIARDSSGEIVAGVSTSGLALKFPGRVGDSPIIGAGLYATKFGAAACVGTGELAIRLSLARIAVKDMEQGKDVSEVATTAIKDVLNLNAFGGLQILVMNANGTVSAATNETKLNLYYVVQTSKDKEPHKITTPIITN